jgi:predicted glutamine amidotransferase
MRMDASFDSALAQVRRLTAPNILIAHARAASKGGAKMENTHPFVIDGIVLGHNGTVHDLAPPEGMSPKGESDSEVIAMLVAARLLEKGDMESALRSVIIEDILTKDFSAAILLASDGSKLYGYRDFSDDAKAHYYDLRFSSCSDHVALFQETYLDYQGNVLQVSKGEMVTVSLDMSVRRQQIR